MNVNKNATNQLTQLRNAFPRHTAALLGCLWWSNLSAQAFVLL